MKLQAYVRCREKEWENGKNIPKRKKVLLE